jgi:hypothetical protein
VIFDVTEVLVGREYGGVVQWNTRRSLEEGSAGNSSLILAEARTYRKDPLDGFNHYSGGWNISNQHYWAVSVFIFRLSKHFIYLSSIWVFFFLNHNPIISSFFFKIFYFMRKM